MKKENTIGPVNLKAQVQSCLYKKEKYKTFIFIFYLIAIDKDENIFHD